MSLTKKITVLLADDHSVVRQGLCALLNAAGAFTIVGQARTGREAVEMALRLRPDVVLMDVAMPVLNGLEATRQILNANPKAKILILSAHTDDEYIERMTAVGAVGFLEKQTSPEILTKALREVANGGRFFSPAIERRLIVDHTTPRKRDGRVRADAYRLTPREAQILQLIAEGSANKQVARLLAISIKTVEKHRQNLMDKLKIHDVSGLTRYAMAAGVIASNLRVTIV